MPPKVIRRPPLARPRRDAPRARGTAPERPTFDRVRQGVGNLQAPTGYQHVLMGEMVTSFVIIGIRALADYVPADDMRSPGTEAPNKGASPIVLITATLGVFFVLSFLATRGGWAAKTSAAFGLLMIIALLINSEAELAQVGTWIQSIGTNSASQPAQAQTNPGISTPGTGSSGGTGSNGKPLPPPIPPVKAG